MKLHRYVVTLGAVIFSLPLAADTKIAIHDLPQAVQTAMKAQTKGATVLGASKEKENGRMTYEVETKVDGKSRDLAFDESGALLEVEQEVAIDSIPAAAKEESEREEIGSWC